MSQPFEVRHKPILVLFLSVFILGTAICINAQAIPIGQSSSSTAKAKVQAQLQDVDAKIAAARAHQDALQAQIAKLEQGNAAQHKQLQQRDAEIAALQRKLAAAGVPASSTSAGH